MFRFRVVHASNRCEVPVSYSFKKQWIFMQTRDVDYRCEEAKLFGYLAWNESSEPRPGVLVFHEGLGLGDFTMERARRLAELGYVALAADMFGQRRPARNLQEVATLVGGLRAEPTRLRAPGRAALETLASLPQVQAHAAVSVRVFFRGLGGSC